MVLEVLVRSLPHPGMVEAGMVAGQRQELVTPWGVDRAGCWDAGDDNGCRGEETGDELTWSRYLWWRVTARMAQRPLAVMCPWGQLLLWRATHCHCPCGWHSWLSGAGIKADHERSLGCVPVGRPKDAEDGSDGWGGSCRGMCRWGEVTTLPPFPQCSLADPS